MGCAPFSFTPICQGSRQFSRCRPCIPSKQEVCGNLSGRPLLENFAGCSDCPKFSAAIPITNLPHSVPGGARWYGFTDAKGKRWNKYERSPRRHASPPFAVVTRLSKDATLP